MGKSVIIIGAGLGGMASAIRLAKQGWRVTVLEKNTRVGGKLGCHAQEGFLWDVGPTGLSMVSVLRELFDHADHHLEDYLDLVQVDPTCRYFFPDGRVMNAWARRHLFEIEVARREGDQGEALERFMRYAEGLYKISAEARLFEPPQRNMNYLGMRFLKLLPHLGKVLNFRSMARVVEQHFRDPQIRQFFMRYATYTGSSPYLAPSLFNVISYLEIEGGTWHVRGGMYRLAEAMEKCARDLGVEFLLDAEVSEIGTVQKKRFGRPRVTGVTIRDTIHRDADFVLCNADVAHVWTRLLRVRGQKGMARRLGQRPFSTSPFIMLLGVRERDERLAHHNVFFSSDYRTEFNDIFQKHRPPAEPTIYVGISARTDPTQAPPGQDNYFVLVNTPAIEPDHHWENSAGEYREIILKRLEKMGLDSLRRNIVCEKVITPADFAARNNAYRGAIYGHAQHSLASLFQRPDARCRQVEGLYFAGGCVRPGGGIPLVLLSAQHAVRAMLADAD